MAKRPRLILTKDGERAFALLADGIARSLDAILREERVKKKQLAQRASVEPAVISRLLDGSRNLEIRTVSAVFGALGYALLVKPRSLHAPSGQPSNHPRPNLHISMTNDESITTRDAVPHTNNRDFDSILLEEEVA